MTTRIKLRRDTAANWTENNPILANGEPGLETDTRKIKYGDGTTHWADLDYADNGVVPRELVGSFLTHGTVPNYSNNGQDWWFESVVGDPSGGAYYMGGYFEYGDYTGSAHVVKVDVGGDVVWSKEINWADGYEGAAVSGIYNTATDQLVVVAQWQKNTTGAENDSTAVVIKLDAETGNIAGDVTVIRDDYTADGSEYGYINVSDVELTASGDPIVVGNQWGNLTTYNLTTQTGSTLNYLFVDASVFPAGDYPINYNGWYITGTNITNKLYITEVNEYYNTVPVPIVPTAGMGAMFDISKDGVGGYVINSVVSGGTGYQWNNTILILGSYFGGTDGLNDATVRVTGVDAGVITSASISGLAQAGTENFPTASGTNVVSGSNFVVNNYWRMKGPNVYFPGYQSKFGFWVQQAGSGYAVGDQFYLNPEQYGGLTSGTITVTSVGSGDITDFTFTGTFNTSTVKLYTGNNGIDYGVEGSWQAWHQENQGAIWTPDWQAVFGDTAYDNANAVATDSQGNIYIAAKTYDYAESGGQNIGALVKVSSTGTMLWAKNYEPADWDWYDDGITGVAVDSNDDVIIGQNNLITKVDSDGAVLWQKQIGYAEPMGQWNVCVDVDSDNNIYVAGEYDYMGQTTGDDYLIMKFDTDGNLLWQREAGTTADEDFNWNNGYQIISVQGNKFYVAGSTYQGDDDVALGISFPTDGSGAGDEYHGRFLYKETNWSVSTSTATVVDSNFFWSTATFLTVTTTSTFTASTGTATDAVLYVRTGDTGGRLEDVYSITFEDGSVQKTAYKPGYTMGMDSPKIYDTQNYYLTLADAGKMTRWAADGWNDSVDIYVPHNDQVPFEIGTQMHFMKDKGIRLFFFWCDNRFGNSDDITIMPANPADGMQGYAYDTSEGWSVKHPNEDHVPCIVTLTKVDTNRWLLSCNSNVHIMDWSY